MAMSDMLRASAIVLVVEDEPLQRMMMVDSVEEAGLEALETWSAEAAVELLERRPDVRLVLSDIDMPGGMSGLELAALVRERWPPIEIVITSAGPPPDVSHLPVRAVFMPKPLDRDRLREALRQLAQGDPESGA